jgi:putative endonuclease
MSSFPRGRTAAWLSACCGVATRAGFWAGLEERVVVSRSCATASWPGLARPSMASIIERMRGGWLYMMTNRPNGTLYTGVTSNISRRAWEHREGLIEGFTKRYGLKRLIYMERYEDIRDAIQREKTIKHYPRAWKVRLILEMNPEWNDLYDTLG